MRSSRTALRTHTFTESVIREMTRVANEHGALNLAQGFPEHPIPAPVLEALERLSADADDAVFIGDSPHDVQAGHDAGVSTAAALWGPFPTTRWLALIGAGCAARRR